MKKLPKTIWVARVNLVGLYSKKPVKCSMVETEYCDNRATWWDESGDFDVNLLGEGALNHDCITFASANKKEVELWIAGAIAAYSILKNFTNSVK